MSDKKLLVVLPFQGFYCSYLSDSIDSELENYLDDKGLGYDHIDYLIDFQAIARLYVSFYETFLNDALDINISIEFESLTMPKAYNFVTDRIFAEITLDDAKAVKDAFLKKYGTQYTQSKADAIYRSRSGFLSYYADYADGWQGKAIADCDHNELSLFLISEYDYNDFDYDFIEHLSCNGELSNAIEINLIDEAV